MPASFEELDNVAWEHGQQLFLASRPKLLADEVYYAIAKKIIQHRKGGPPYEMCGAKRGAFNVCYRARFLRGPDALFRLPMTAYFQNLDEKLAAEVAALRCVRDTTSIPVPFVLHHGSKDECPDQLGSFVIMEWVDSDGNMADVLNRPELGIQDTPELNPDISEARLETMYGQMAEVLLQMATVKHDRIGALGVIQDSGGGQDRVDAVTRPLTLNMSQLGNFARVPHFQLPPVDTTYATSSAYYSALADMHLQQLSYQRSRAIDSAEDCQKKYLARQLFRKAATENRLADPEFEHGPFLLWCDDFRPSNVLVDKVGGDVDSRLAAVIDWEFTHSAPAEFLYTPPWWLLLKAPDDWPAGLDDWAAHYEPRLAVFLRAMEAKEDEMITEHRLAPATADAATRMSARMRANWTSGRFWVTYAARKTWAFDAIYWRFLDERLFGKNEGGNYMARASLLPPAQVAAMAPFVERKLREKAEGGIVDWYEAGAEAKLPPDILAVGLKKADGQYGEAPAQCSNYIATKRASEVP